MSWTEKQWQRALAEIEMQRNIIAARASAYAAEVVALEDEVQRLNMLLADTPTAPADE